MARLIRASEIGEYVFCHRAWWLRIVEGYTPADHGQLAAGTRRHRAHGAGVAVSRVLLLAGLLLLVAGALGLLLGV
jgi:CRISPR/Cas system-associated exonuclease Cas4 (RecB family)